MLAYADGSLSDDEEKYLDRLAQRMNLSEKIILEIKCWVGDFSDILSRMEVIIESVK